MRMRHDNSVSGVQNEWNYNGTNVLTINGKTYTVLPDLDQRSLLPERISPEAARRDVVKGVGVAAAALLIAGAANGDLGGSERGAADVVAATAAITGVVAFLLGRRHGAIPENVAANARNRAQRDSVKAAVRARNADRIAATVLLVAPAAGEGVER